MKRIPSPRITQEMAALIKRLIRDGVYQHQIASALGINQGRVSEVNTGKCHPKVSPVEQLPLNFG